MRFLAPAALCLTSAVFGTAFPETPTAASIDAIARPALAELHIPGMAVCVLSHGRVVASSAYGVADLENAVPVTTESRFSIASTTKEFTAAAILRLAESGTLCLDDDVTRFVPDLPLRGRGVTIERLLNHTAGVRNLQELGDRYWNQTHSAATTKELVDLVRNEPLDFEPGTDFRYSNSGYILLGAVIEAASGEPYGEFLARSFFEPLGLHRTRVPEGLRLLDRRVHPYWFDGSKFNNAAYFDASQGFSMGGIYSTAEDLARWTEALHHGRVLGPFFYQRMITPGMLADGEEITYGYAMEVGSIGGRHIYSHPGGGVGFISQALYVPEEDLTVAVLTNSNFDGGAIEVADRILRAILELAGPLDLPVPETDAKRYAGRYCMSGEVVEILARGSTLSVRYPGDEPVRLRSQGGGVFAQDGRLSRLQFREISGRVAGFFVGRYGAILGRATREDSDGSPR
jgi:CubicO group peptidase (beta-lactamase class C family)